MITHESSALRALTGWRTNLESKESGIQAQWHNMRHNGNDTAVNNFHLPKSRGNRLMTSRKATNRSSFRTSSSCHQNFHNHQQGRNSSPSYWLCTKQSRRMLMVSLSFSGCSRFAFSNLALPCDSTLRIILILLTWDNEVKASHRTSYPPVVAQVLRTSNRHPATFFDSSQFVRRGFTSSRFSTLWMRMWSPYSGIEARKRPTHLTLLHQWINGWKSDLATPSATSGQPA